MSSKKRSGLKKVADYTVLAPVNLLFNRSAKTNTSIYMSAVRGGKKVYCPHCTQGFLLLKPTKQDEEQENDKNTPVQKTYTWACTNCDLEVDTQTNNQKELLSVLEEHGYQWYQDGVAAGVDAFSDTQRQSGVKQFLRRALVFYVLALLCLLFVPYFILNSTALPTINMLLLLSFLALSGLLNAFRAWKLHNDLLFYPEHKKLFMMWFKKGRYYTPWVYKKGE